MLRKMAPYHVGEIPYSTPKIVTATKAKLRNAFYVHDASSLGSDKAGHDV
jgi:hypothetical protein